MSIQVTKTYLPDIDKYKSYVEDIFASGWLTNNGVFVQRLQQKLCDYFGVKNILLTSNGTIALQVAYKLLGLRGSVITTPFSFVATTSSILWENLNPIFCDIDPKTLNIDAGQLRDHITDDTSAIVATHVYGNPCHIEAIDNIAKEYGLKVIYDAAHAFGVDYKGKSLLQYGDVSTISFHSTKLFHTIEGGALIINDDELYEKAKRLINFGIVSPTEITDVGINGKMNEFQAAMGLCVLDDIEDIFRERKIRYSYYKENLNSEKLQFQKIQDGSTENYSHFPVLFTSEDLMERAIAELNKKDIFPRRYFYPSLNKLPYFTENQEMKVAEDIASRILCLPLSTSLSQEVQDLIIETIKQSLL